MSEFQFKPHPGRMRSRGDASAKRYLKLVRTQLKRPGRFTGTRIGRGAGFGHVAAARHPFTKYRTRRVMVKVHTVRIGGQSRGGAKAHLTYIERDGVDREGAEGQFYDATSDRADGKDFLERGAEDRHQFRLIVSPEDAEELTDLKHFTRDLMSQAEEDLGTKLDWVAVDHYNTDHPHSHIVLRGVDQTDNDLVIAKDYITHGFRRRAEELATRELGLRSDKDIAFMQKAQTTQDRFTALDREILNHTKDGHVAFPKGHTSYDRFRRTLMQQRLQKLERLGLAKEQDKTWHVSEQLEPTLRRLGERGDIIRTMQRAIGDRNPQDFAIFDPGDSRQKPIIGRVAAEGPSDELRNNRFVIIDGVDGRQTYVDLGGSQSTIPPIGSIIEIGRRDAAPRPSDQTIAAIARNCKGLYSDAFHEVHDPTASAEFRLAHKRRLEAMRRAGLVTRQSDGTWGIPNDYLERAQKFDARRSQGAKLTVLSWQPLEQLAEREAATWLDKDISSGTSGFGADVRDALAARRRWLLSKAHAEEREGEIKLKKGALQNLEQAEIKATANKLTRSMNKTFRPLSEGRRIEGRLSGTVNLASGRYAIVERSKDFALVPWRPELEPHRGKRISGIMRSQGINWQFNRQRGLSR